MVVAQQVFKLGFSVVRCVGFFFFLGFLVLGSYGLGGV